MDDLISRSWLLSEYDKRHKGPAGGARKLIEEAPSALGTNLAEVGTDCISRQAAINAIDECYCGGEDSCGEPWIYKENAVEAIQMIEPIPSAQPERTCVNCGRTVNNGGWYADGGTRCPIEEHYALPKDGFCHLWEKRNVTDDDYPERRTDGEIIPE